MTWDQGPHHLQEAAPAWGVLPKLLQTEARTSQDPQLEIAQKEICRAKKKLGTPICWSCPLQEGSDELQGPGWRDNSLSSTATAAPEQHTQR